MARLVICPICKKQIEVRNTFAHETLNRHLQQHKEKK
jgi:hypothetical protein